MDIDKWTAKQCGIIFKESDEGLMILVVPKELPFDERIWTMQDARCREIVREHFGIFTDKYSNGGWFATPRKDIDVAIMCLGQGKTIPEAEIACIQAIMEADNG